MPGKYAESTDVPVARSQAEIEAILDRFGATAFAYARQANQVMIAFEFQGRRYRIMLRLPAWEDYKFKVPQSVPHRKSLTAREQFEQETRRRWRSLALWIKATLVAIDDGIITAQQALLPFTMLPDGSTVGDWVEPQIVHVYETGRMPTMLPGLPGRSDLTDDGG